MSSGEIPTLPVLVPATAAAVIASWWWLDRRGRLTLPRAAVGVLASGYAAGLLGHVLLPFPIETGGALPWRVWLHLTPFVDVAEDPIGLVLNVALFVPFGLLLPLLVRATSARRVVAAGFGVSLGIELTQLVASLTVSPGRIADVDDLIGNSIGALLGYVLFAGLMRIPSVSRIVARAAWTSDRAPVEVGAAR